MRLERIEIEHFRCFNRLSHDLPPGRVLLVGDNASGKTTFLEAVYYLVTGRSFRTRHDRECLPWGAPRETVALARGLLRDEAGDASRLTVAFDATRKNVRIDGRPISNLGELWGRLRAVLFTPGDLELVQGPPGARRRYLDIALGQIRPGYLERLRACNQALRQRNALLRRAAPARPTPDLRRELAPWNRQLAAHGLPLSRERHAFVATLGPRAVALHGELCNDANRPGEGMGLRYACCLGDPARLEQDDAEQTFLELLEENTGEDLRRGSTSAGPHRDELRLTLGGRSARDYGSQGQQRSIALSLRLAEVHEMRERTGETPLVLLDDLASELDPHRKRRLIEHIDPHWQCLMTTTRREDFPDTLEFDLQIALPAGQDEA